MPRNGSGVFSLPGGSTITNGDTSDASDLNTPFADLVSDANAARPIVAGGTGATSASAARTALGLAIGTDVQAQDANLASIAGLTLAADKGLYSTAANTAALFDLTTAGRALLDDADAAAQRTTLGLGTAATVDVIDEDSFATDSATRPPSQQSTKAYVAAQVAASTPDNPVFAWAQFDSAGTIADSNGISSVVRDSTGEFTVTLSSAEPDDNYAVFVSKGGFSGSESVTTITTTNFTLSFKNLSNNSTNPTTASIMCVRSA